MCGKTWALKAVPSASGTGHAGQQSGSESPRQQQQPAAAVVAGAAAEAGVAAGVAGVAGLVVGAASRDRLLLQWRWNKAARTGCVALPCAFNFTLGYASSVVSV
jgi:hypothetical protein